jgi:2-amino-4-hydroxy-6-hydroxymethyldihydropteridine diphosphokinase
MSDSPARAAVLAYIGLGANLGDAARTVQRALSALAQLPTSRCVASSSLYHSKPVGHAEQPDYINAVAVVETRLSPHALLATLLAVEHRFGRQRTFRNAPRTLDLDLLVYGDRVIQSEHLIVPHPRLAERAFALMPLHEVAPDLVLPGLGPVADLLNQVDCREVARCAPYPGS